MKNTNTNENSSQNINARKGFAFMDEEKQKEIASKVGKAAQEKVTVHEFTSKEAE